MGAYIFYRVMLFLVSMLGAGLGWCTVHVCSRAALPFCYWIVPSWLPHAISLVTVAALVIPQLFLMLQLLGAAPGPVYEVVQGDVGGNSAVQLRRYAPLVLVETQATGSTARERVSKGVAPLSAYVTGRNGGVGVSGRPERVGMTGVVACYRDPDSPQKYRVGMLLPPRGPASGAEDVWAGDVRLYPRPVDPGVALRAFPPAPSPGAGFFAAISLSGYGPTEELLATKGDELVAAAGAAGVRLDGQPMFLMHLNRNKAEILIPALPPA